MNFLISIWTWFNGKKTVIGLAMLAAVTLINQWIIGVNHFHPLWLDTVINNFSFLGELFTGGGLLHKGLKIANTKTE